MALVFILSILYSNKVESRVIKQVRQLFYLKKKPISIYNILRIMKLYQLHSFIIFILVMVESVENILMKMNKMDTILSNEKAIFYYRYMAYHIPLSTNEKLIKYK